LSGGRGARGGAITLRDIVGKLYGINIEMRQARPYTSGGSNPALSVPSRSNAQIGIQKPLHPTVVATFPNYLLLEVEPVTSGGGGIMFHVSARYFQFAPSSAMTLR
jgi:hypothetical protein